MKITWLCYSYTRMVVEALRASTKVFAVAEDRVLYTSVITLCWKSVPFWLHGKAELTLKWETVLGMFVYTGKTRKKRGQPPRDWLVLRWEKHFKLCIKNEMKIKITSTRQFSDLRVLSSMNGHFAHSAILIGRIIKNQSESFYFSSKWKHVLTTVT